MSIPVSGRRACVLYVDDSPDDRRMVEQAARSADSSLVFSFLDGYLPAIAYLSGDGPFVDREQHPVPGLVLLDYALNSHTGADILRWLRAREGFKSLPVVMYSDSDSPERVAHCYGAGANYYIRKAATFARLTDVVKILARCFASDPRSFGLLAGLSEYRRPL